VRYRKDHKQQTNQRILRAAGRLFRKQGYAATGVDAVMKSADLTALLAGAVLLARAVADETFSQEVLGTCREAAMEAIVHSSGNRG